MAMLKNLNNFLLILVDTFKSLGRGSVWGVLFIYFLVMTLVLYAHYNFLSPIFYGLIRSTTSLVSGELSDRFFHYPSHFLYLPWFFGWAKLIVGVFLEGLFLGAAAILLYRWYTRAPKQGARPAKSVLSMWPQLFAVSLIFNALVTIISLWLPKLLQDFLEGSPRRQVFFELGIMPFIYVLLMALFLLAIPIVAVHRQTFYTAIGRSFRFFTRRPFTAFFLSFIVLILPILVSAAANHPDTIIQKFRPELVFWLLFAGLVADLIANFLWMGSAVRILVDEER